MGTLRQYLPGLPALFFWLVFAVYFAGAVGPMNSIDAPQYLAAEAFLRSLDFDLRYMFDDPHGYMAHPDFAIRDNNRHLPIRGWVTSFLGLPANILGRALAPFMSLSWFPKEVQATPCSAMEIAVTALFSAFTALAVSLLASLARNFAGAALAYGVAVSLAFGTYAWKYSTSYTRHGIETLLIVGFCAAWWHGYEKGRDSYRIGCWLAWALSFGLDPMLFFVLSAWLAVGLGPGIIRNPALIRREAGWPAVVAVFILLTIVVLNCYWFGAVLGYIEVNDPAIQEMKQKFGSYYWYLAPLFPVLWAILFNYGTLPPATLVVTEGLVGRFSDAWARKSFFLGLFCTSPFLLPGLVAPAVRSLSVAERRFATLCIAAFFLGVALHSKLIFFWGSTQYDTRYFYAYTFFLGIPAVLVFRAMLAALNRRLAFLPWSLLAVTGFFAIFVGWLGVMNQFMPSVLGENRISIQLYSAEEALRAHGLRAALWATFMNGANTWLVLLLWIGWTAVSRVALKSVGLYRAPHERPLSQSAAGADRGESGT